MAHFVDRQEELAELDALVGAARRGRSAFIITYGRRRVGKTTLLLHWAAESGLSTLYWVARRETAEATRQSLASALWRWAYPDDDTAFQAPRFSGWEDLFRQLARLLPDTPTIVILDEFSYAVESDASLPSHLQAAWDHYLKSKPLILVVAGSHIGMMVDMLGYHAPLYGRFTGQLPLGPLPFAALREFFPNYTAAERVATYAVLGGVAGYWERFNPDRDLVSNLRDHLFRRMGMFRSEPMVLISDLVRETRNYEAVLRTVAAGSRTTGEIASASGLAPPNISPYIKRLVELGFLERRLPVTVPPERRRATTRSRYHVSDPYLRFYFRFMEPNLELIEQGLVDLLWRRIREQFRAFIGLTTWEELCRQWVVAQLETSVLPYSLEFVGSHWAADSQVDVAGINWRDRIMLLGECKWGRHPVGRKVIRELVDKSPRVLPAPDWEVRFIFFARRGFTDAARAEAAHADALLVDLHRLDADLTAALQQPG